MALKPYVHKALSSEIFKWGTEANEKVRGDRKGYRKTHTHTNTKIHSQINFKSKILGSECQASGTYAKGAKQATKKKTDCAF
jgi:hypothetical protein